MARRTDYTSIEEIRAELKKAWTEGSAEYEAMSSADLFGHLLATFSPDFNHSETGREILRLKILCILGRRLNLGSLDDLRALEESVDLDAIEIPARIAERVMEMAKTIARPDLPPGDFN